MSTLQGSDIKLNFSFWTDTSRANYKPIASVTSVYAKVYNNTDKSVLCELEYPATGGKQIISQIGSVSAVFSGTIPYTLTKDAEISNYTIEIKSVEDDKICKYSAILTNFLKSETNA